MPGPGCVCMYAMPWGGKSIRSHRASHGVAGSRSTSREKSAPRSSSSSSHTRACPSTFAAPKNGSLRSTS